MAYDQDVARRERFMARMKERKIKLAQGEHPLKEGLENRLSQVRQADREQRPIMVILSAMLEDIRYSETQQQLEYEAQKRIEASQALEDTSPTLVEGHGQAHPRTLKAEAIT